MKILLSTSKKTLSEFQMKVIVSTSAVKRTVQAQIAATKEFPKTAELIRKLSEKIKLLKKQALKNYIARKKADASKGGKKTSHSSVILSSELEENLLNEQVEMSDDDLAECCADLSSESAAPVVQTKGEKKKEATHLKKELKANPKAALRKKQMSAAMRIRENKDIRAQIKKLLETKKKLQDLS